jgi:hypothetical protein
MKSVDGSSGTNKLCGGSGLKRKSKRSDDERKKLSDAAKLGREAWYRSLHLK